MNSMSRKGQQLNLDHEMSLVKRLGGPDFSASWVCMQVALGVMFVLLSGVIHPPCRLHFDSYSKAMCASLCHPHNSYIRRLWLVWMSFGGL